MFDHSAAVALGQATYVKSRIIVCLSIRPINSRITVCLSIRHMPQQKSSAAKNVCRAKNSVVLAIVVGSPPRELPSYVQDQHQRLRMASWYATKKWLMIERSGIAAAMP
jgi:hypothetical protein